MIERLTRPKPGWPEIKSPAYILNAFERRKTHLGILRFINRNLKDLTRERFKSGVNNDFLALQFCTENIEAALKVKPNPTWEQEKENLIKREASIWGFETEVNNMPMAS